VYISEVEGGKKKTNRQDELKKKERERKEKRRSRVDLFKPVLVFFRPVSSLLFDYFHTDVIQHRFF
jgi:hypothetical protein